MPLRYAPRVGDQQPGSASLDSRSDEQLVSLCNGGNEGAFEVLYLRYREWVVRLAWRFTRNDADALDVLQETFSYVLGKMPGLRLTARFTTFLFPVVKNLSIAARRKRDRALGEGPLPEGAAPSVPEGDGSREDLAAALASLSEEHRETLLLRYVEDMTQEEIAAALGVPVGTVKSRIHNAIDALRGDPRARDYFCG